MKEELIQGNERLILFPQIDRIKVKKRQVNNSNRPVEDDPQWASSTLTI